MKKLIAGLIICALCLCLTACGAQETGQGNVDVDLTKLSSTMVYSEVYNMLTAPGDYTGKTVKMTGSFNVWHDDQKDKNYFSCLIADATACCAQGIEFELKDSNKYPNEYPQQGSMITVTGTFGTYLEDGYLYCQLKDAVLA